MQRTTSQDIAIERSFLRLPVVSLAAEYLVAGHLMRRNVLAYKAPPGNEGYDFTLERPTKVRLSKARAARRG
jgi:hypothetical protein